MKNDKIQRSRIAVKDLKARKDVKGGVKLDTAHSQISSSGSKPSSSGSTLTSNTTVS